MRKTNRGKKIKCSQHYLFLPGCCWCVPACPSPTRFFFNSLSSAMLCYRVLLSLLPRALLQVRSSPPPAGWSRATTGAAFSTAGSARCAADRGHRAAPPLGRARRAASPSAARRGLCPAMTGAIPSRRLTPPGAPSHRLVSLGTEELVQGARRNSSQSSEKAARWMAPS